MKQGKHLKDLKMKGFGEQYTSKKKSNKKTKPSKEQIINQAFKSHSQGNIPEAAKYYQEFITQGFKDQRVFSNYGVILKDLGKLQDAELSTRKAIELNPNFADAHSNLGSILKDLGKLQDAELSTRKAIELNPNFAMAHNNLGSILRDLGKLQEAELSTRKAIEIKPDYAEAHSILGNILRDLGKLQEAELSLKKAIEIKPDYAMAHSNLGTILKDLRELQDAELSYRKAIEIKPDYPEAYLNLGNILKNLGKLKEAELSTRKAIELNPDYAMAHSNLGGILEDLGKLKEAELSTHKAIEIKPDFAEAHYNLGNIFRDRRELQEAELSYRKAIEIKPDYAEAYLNLGNILKDLGKLKDAELSTRKAIEIKPDYAMAHSNLGGILMNLGKLKDAELSTRKAIEINPELAKAYFNLSILKYSNSNNDTWKNKLFSKNIISNKLPREQVDIYFARANIRHKEKNYEDSSKYLQLANNLKLDLNPSDSDTFINKSSRLLIESNKKEIHKKEHKNCPESVFIVGMPRSGSTLLESILSMNININDLGESNILEESLIEKKEVNQEVTLAELYWRKISNNKNELSITTNKDLYNYQYAGIILSQIPNAKIIHCFRNTLDNILSIYRAHFTIGNEYSSSLVDSAKVYLDQEAIMNEYKNRFRSKIYDLNYDSLATNPNTEIRSLISWLGWEWNDSYLSPHLNPRSVSTASNVQVRSPINSKSIGGWKNYKDMLKPAIEILTKNDRYQDITY